MGRKDIKAPNNKGACSNNGLYISKSLLEKIRDDYNQLYKEYKQDIKKLKENGIKINYIKIIDKTDINL